MKVCSSCGTEKPESEYTKRKASKDGLASACRECLKERDAKRYEKEREHRIARHKAYMATPQGKEAHKRATEKWKDANKVRRAAQIILGNALKYKTITRQPCWVCGEKAEAHHPDYSRPLDVVWLCKKHHKEVHSMSKKEQL
jgi:hypothetical protein